MRSSCCCVGIMRGVAELMLRAAIQRLTASLMPIAAYEICHLMTTGSCVWGDFLWGLA